MNPLSVFTVALVLVASSHGGVRVMRQNGWGQQGWNQPQQGWGPPPPPPQANPTVITEEGASEAVGVGGAIAEHDAIITVVGSPEVPALLSISTGSGVGLYQSASNYQQSQINTDGSSQAYQGNSASNSGYAYDYLGGDAQGLNVDVQSNGWSAVEGEGAVGQVDALNHQGGAAPTTAPPPSNSGWKRP